MDRDEKEKEKRGEGIKGREGTGKDREGRRVGCEKCVCVGGGTHTHTLSPLSLPSLFALFLSLRATYHDEV